MASKNEENTLKVQSQFNNLKLEEQQSSITTVKSSRLSASSRSEYDFVSMKKSSSLEDSSVTHSEMDFDPENTPRDPVTDSSRTSISSDVGAEEAGSSSQDGVFFTLDALPLEMLLHICSFLEAGVVIGTLSRVCRKFYYLFLNEPYWKIRLLARWPKKYPPIDYEEMNWKRCCVERERIHRVWSDPEEHMEHFTYSDSLFAAVDVVHLMQGGRLLAAGSRDRYLTLLDLSKYDSSRPETKKEMRLQFVNKAHNGWIWSMASLDNHLYTGSWDTKIKVWDLGQNFNDCEAYKCKSAVLSIYVEQNLIVAGGFDRKVYFIDPRERRIVDIKGWHRQPVLCISADRNFIISGSEDKTFSVFDRRAGLVFKSVQVENYPLDASYHSNQLWFGDRRGHLNLIDTTMGKFEVVGSYDVGHSDKMTGVVHTQGAIYTSSSDKSIKVLEPSLEPQAITTLEQHQTGVARISYQNGVLASAGCDIVIGVWRPKKRWGWCE